MKKLRELALSMWLRLYCMRLAWQFPLIWMVRRSQVYFEDAYTEQTAASYTDERRVEDVASDKYGYSEEEEESVRVKLEALGYL